MLSVLRNKRSGLTITGVAATLLSNLRRISSFWIIFRPIFPDPLQSALIKIVSPIEVVLKGKMVLLKIIYRIYRYRYKMGEFLFAQTLAISHVVQPYLFE